MTRSDFRLLDPLRVRWAEVDMQRIVFNGHYLMYADTAVAAYWRALAMPYHETMEALGGDLYVRKATVEYLGSARYDDQLDVGVRMQRIGTSSIVFVFSVFRGERTLVTGDLVYVYADPTTQTSRPVPQMLRDWLLTFEARESMVSVDTGDWPTLKGAAQALREQVFVHEQGIAPELEWDEADATALHAVARNRGGLPLGTGRLLPHTPGAGRIGRMAVRADMRGSGVGMAVLQALVDAARSQGLQHLVLHAQVTAASFYRRAGFEPRGPVFDEVGIPHQEMVRDL
jgi:YbgC/YbaW family acyl-CoA thioester hydrolase